jgi:hypothetical protein
MPWSEVPRSVLSIFTRFAVGILQINSSSLMKVLVIAAQHIEGKLGLYEVSEHSGRPSLFEVSGA